MKVTGDFKFFGENDIFIREWTVFGGERHFKFFKAGVILDITSLKKEKLSPYNFGRNVALIRWPFARPAGNLQLLSII